MRSVSPGILATCQLQRVTSGQRPQGPTPTVNASKKTNYSPDLCADICSTELTVMLQKLQKKNPGSAPSFSEDRAPTVPTKHQTSGPDNETYQCMWNGGAGGQRQWKTNVKGRKGEWSGVVRKKAHRQMFSLSALSTISIMWEWELVSCEGGRVR